MRHPVLAFAALLLLAAPAAAQSLQELPFDKQMTLAKVGDVDAQFEVGLAYETGKGGVTVDEAEAARWFRQAALQGNVDAQYHLARLVSRGAKGLKQDYPTALKLYQDAATKGYAPAMDALGQAYQQGRGTGVDLAFAMFQAAATQGDPWGLNNLGGMYEMGWGTTVDKTKALDLYQQSVAAGNNRAQQNIDRLQGKNVAVE